MALGQNHLKIVAPSIKIVAFSMKKIWGSFWRFLALEVALANSKHLTTLIYFIFTCIFSSDFQCAQFRNQNIDKEQLCACSNLIHFFWKVKQGSKRNPPQLHLRSIVWRYSTLWQNFDTQSLKLDAFGSQEGFSYST